MNKNYLIVAGAVVVALVAAVVVFHSSPQLAGDFAGGIQPGPLFTCNVSTNSCTPNLSNLYVNGATSVGGTIPNNQITVLYTATTSYPAVALTLGSISATTSTTSTNIGIPVAGFSVGDPCSAISYNGASSSALISYDGNITAAGTNNATATILFMNVGTSTTTFTVTSTATGVSSTLKATCIHTGV
jgi:hypothetical protein